MSANLDYESPATVEDYFAIVNTFLGGVEVSNFIPNGYACSDAAYDYAKALNLTLFNVTGEVWRNDTIGSLKQFTTLISEDFADMQLDCQLAYIDYMVYTNETIANFGNTSNWFQGFLQNMVGQLVSLNKYRSNIATATLNSDYKAVYHYAGRMVHLLLTFDPIDLLQFAPLEEQVGKTAFARYMEIIELGASLQKRIDDGSLSLEALGRAMPASRHPLVG